MREGPFRGRRRRARIRGGALAAAALTLAAGAPAADAYNSVPTTSGDSWGVHDGAAPGVDTGSIRNTSGAALRGYGGIRVRVAGKLEGRSALLNGELMRGFGLRFDGVDQFKTTKAVEIGGVSMTREIKIQRSDRYARFFDTFTNTTSQGVTVDVVFGGMTGYNTGENQSEVVATSSGDLVPTVADSWVALASPTTRAGNPSQNGPSAAVIGSPNTSVAPTDFLRRGGFDIPLPLTGHEANHQGYGHRFTLAAGETRSLARFVVIGVGEKQGTGGTADNARPDAGTEVAAVKLRAEQLVAVPPLGDLSTAELCSLRNWTPAAITAGVPSFDSAVCATIPKLDTQAAPQPKELTTSSPYDVVEKTVQELRADMESGETTSQEITQAYLDRIATYDTGQFGFHSFTWVADDAMAQARKADEARAKGAKGPLLGIPVAFKDLYDTKDMPTTNGSQVFEGFYPREDAFQVKRVRDAGAVIIGKATMAEYANSGYFSDSAWGQVWNAYDPSKSSIGSSGGSAVAMALSFVPVTFGSQTGDSLWGPASAASIFSLRGTDGLQSASGVMPLTYVNDYAGAFALSPADLADTLNVVVGTDPKDPLTAETDAKKPENWRTSLNPEALKGKRIGYIPEVFNDPFQTTGTSDAMKAAFAKFVAAGAEVVPIPAAPNQPPVQPGGGGDTAYEGWARWIDAHPENPYKDAGEIIASQKRLPYSRRAGGVPAYTTTGRQTATQVSAGYARRKLYRQVLGQWMDDNNVDAVLYAGLLSDVGMNDGITPSFGRIDPPSSASGAPTMIFPGGVNDHGEPFNFQLLGREWDDAKLLGFAYAYDQVAKARIAPTTAPKLAYEPGVTPKPIVIERPADPITTAPKPDADTNTTATGTTTPAPASTPGASTPPALVTKTLVLPASVTSKITRLKGKRLRITGKVTPPGGTTGGCSGKVTVRVKAGKATLIARGVKLSKSCTFSTIVTLKTKRAKVSVSARFLGNDALKPRSATTKTVRVG